MAGLLKILKDKFPDIASDLYNQAQDMHNNFDKVYKHNLVVTVSEQTPGIIATNLWDYKGEINKAYICSTRGSSNIVSDPDPNLAQSDQGEGVMGNIKHSLSSTWDYVKNGFATKIQYRNPPKDITTGAGKGVGSPGASGAGYSTVSHNPILEKGPIMPANYQPRLEFNRDVENVHIHLVDKTNGKVHWDVIFGKPGRNPQSSRDEGSSRREDRNQNAIMRGINKTRRKLYTHSSKAVKSIMNPLQKIGLGSFLADLFSIGGTNAKFNGRMNKIVEYDSPRSSSVIGGTQQEFLTLCPPSHDGGGPHWYELTAYTGDTLGGVMVPKRMVGGERYGTFLGRVRMIETHPLDVPTAGMAHREGDLIERVEPYVSMFVS